MAVKKYLSPADILLSLDATAAIYPGASENELIVETGSGIRGANSYVSIEAARAYFVGRRLHSSAWTIATRETQEIALRQASSLLDGEFSWTGKSPVTAYQGLAWPFQDATDRYGNTVVGVPKAVKDATCELAFFLLAQDRLTETAGVGLKSLRVDTISLVFDKSQGPQTFPAHVSRMLLGYGRPVRSTGSPKNIRLYRV